MDKRWYPAAMSVFLIGCGGSTFNEGTDSGLSGGGIDAGMPGETGGAGATGGLPPVVYGPMPQGGSGGAATNVGGKICGWIQRRWRRTRLRRTRYRRKPGNGWQLSSPQWHRWPVWTIASGRRGNGRFETKWRNFRD